MVARVKLQLQISNAGPYRSTVKPSVINFYDRDINAMMGKIQTKRVIPVEGGVGNLEIEIDFQIANAESFQRTMRNVLQEELVLWRLQSTITLETPYGTLTDVEWTNDMRIRGKLLMIYLRVHHCSRNGQFA